MKNPFRYIKNVMNIMVFKVRYGKLVKINMVQTFEKVRINIAHKGSLIMGGFNQNREKLYVGIDGGRLEIGNHCFFNCNSSITCMKHIVIGDYCKFGNNLVIVDHDHNYHADTPEFLLGSVTIGNHVWVGANVVILKDTSIGDNCVIGAGCVVKGEIPANTKLIQQRNMKFDRRGEKC